MTLREALTQATSQLETSPPLRPDAQRDAALLLLHMLGISRAALHAHPDRPLTSEQQATYNSFILRRLGSEPIQYIIGEQEFYGLVMQVSPAALIPRPETEHLVEAVLKELRPCNQPLRILDVGTGSGAIAIALARHLPQAHLTAVDLMPAALALAAANAARHQLADRINFLQSDLLSALDPCDTAFDAIVSNPPYVPTTDRDAIHPQVRDHEPASALFAGPTGLDIYRRLIPQARAALKPNGLLALEFGHGQRDAIVSLLSGWREIRFVEDLQHIPRVALARKP